MLTFNGIGIEDAAKLEQALSEDVVFVAISSLNRNKALAASR